MKSVYYCKCGCGGSVTIYRGKPRQFITGHHMLGRKHAQKTKNKIAAAHTGMTYSQEIKDKLSASKSGHKNPNWKGGRTTATNGYVSIFCPNHPYARNGQISEHRLIMERFIGRYLRSQECIHHINENKKDNRIENLLLLSKVEHTALHNRKMKPETKEKIKNTVMKRWTEGVYDKTNFNP